MSEPQSPQVQGGQRTLTVGEELARFRKAITILNEKIKTQDERIKALEDKHDHVEKKLATPTQLPGSYKVMGTSAPQINRSKHVNINEVMSQNQGIFTE